MAASYPGGYDTMSDPAANLSGPPLHSTMHNQINDVIEAMQVELGLTPSGADATVAATLAALPARYVAFPTAWTAPTFAGAWVNFGGGFANVAYRKVGDVVQLRGLCKSGVIGTTIFTLPAGFRPPAAVLFPVVSNAAFGYCFIDAAGVVQASAGSNVSYCLDSIAFSTVTV